MVGILGVASAVLALVSDTMMQQYLHQMRALSPSSSVASSPRSSNKDNMGVGNGCDSGNGNSNGNGSTSKLCVDTLKYAERVMRSDASGSELQSGTVIHTEETPLLQAARRVEQERREHEQGQYSSVSIEPRTEPGPGEDELFFDVEAPMKPVADGASGGGTGGSGGRERTNHPHQHRRHHHHHHHHNHHEGSNDEDSDEEDQRSIPDERVFIALSRGNSSFYSKNGGEDSDSSPRPRTSAASASPGAVATTDRRDIGSANGTNIQDGSVGCMGLIKRGLVAMYNEIPIRNYGWQFYWYLYNGMFLFGAMVPFWFIGSKFFQTNYLMDVQTADFLMLLPEGAMVVVSPILGFSIDKLRLSLPVKLAMLSAACLGMTVAYLLLSFGYRHENSTAASGDYSFNGVSAADADADDGAVITHSITYLSPIAPMCLLGISYACANSLTLDCIVYIKPDPAELAPASGLYASAINVLPALLPTLIVYLSTLGASEAGGTPAGADTDVDAALRATLVAQSNAGMLVLSVMAFSAAVFGLLASLYGTPDDLFSSESILAASQQNQQKQSQPSSLNDDKLLTVE